MYRSAARRAATVVAASISTFALAMPSATAATAAPDVFAGTAEALAVQLTVTAPSQVLDPITGGAPFTQKISFTTAELSSDGVTSATTSLLAGFMNQGQLSSASGDASARNSVAEQNIAGVIDVGAGTVEYATDAANNLTRSYSELGHIKVSIAPLFASGQIPSQVTEGLQEAVGQVTGTVNQLVGELNGVLGQVEQVVEETAGQVIDIPEVVDAQLPTIPDVTKVTLLEVRKMWSESVVSTVDGKVRSEVRSGLAEASLLDGLVVIPAAQYRSWAETAGTPGTGDAGTEVETIAVRVGGNDISLAGDRIQVGDTVVDLGDLGVTGTPADEALQALSDVLEQLTNTVGLSLAQGAGQSDIAADGSSASAGTSAFALKLSPLNAAGQADVLSVELVALPNTASVSAAQAQAPAVPSETPNMPRTGGGAMIAGIMTMGAAGILRRKTS